MEVERLVLVGFMCSGKSTVGRMLAERLEWEFADFDEIIEREQGKRIVEIFRDHGEGHFRTLEAELTRRVKGRRNAVLAPGGGWATQPELVRMLRPSSLMVWLRVQPETILERHGGETEVERPLLAVDDPRAAISSLLAGRIRSYQQADLFVDTDDLTPEEVVGEITAALGR